MASEKLLNKEKLGEIISGIALRIAGEVSDIDHLAVVGIQTRGVELARRLCDAIAARSGKTVRSGVLDITFHRDDLATRGVLPMIKETRIDFDISNMTILLVDDVIFTGRTIKAALETLTTFGRPKVIKLFTLIDRGNRELPIQPDYCGHTIATTIDDSIDVKLKEIDGEEDAVYLTRDQR